MGHLTLLYSNYFARMGRGMGFLVTHVRVVCTREYKHSLSSPLPLTRRGLCRGKNYTYASYLLFRFDCPLSRGSSSRLMEIRLGLISRMKHASESNRSEQTVYGVGLVATDSFSSRFHSDIEIFPLAIPRFTRASTR